MAAIGSFPLTLANQIQPLARDCQRVQAAFDHYSAQLSPLRVQGEQVANSFAGVVRVVQPMVTRHQAVLDHFNARLSPLLDVDRRIASYFAGTARATPHLQSLEADLCGVGELVSAASRSIRSAVPRFSPVPSLTFRGFPRAPDVNFAPLAPDALASLARAGQPREDLEPPSQALTLRYHDPHEEAVCLLIARGVPGDKLSNRPSTFVWDLLLGMESNPTRDELLRRAGYDIAEGPREDPSAYVEASLARTVLGLGFDSKGFVAWLDRNHPTVRTRSKGRRRLVHAGDFLRLLKWVVEAVLDDREDNPHLRRWVLKEHPRHQRGSERGSG